MKSWKARLLMGLMLVATLLIMVAGPAMADEFGRDCFPFCNDRHDNDHHDNDRHDHFRDFCDDNDDCDDLDVEDFGFFPFFTAFDVDDVDIVCDDDDDDFDGFVECDDLILVAELDDFDIDID